MNADEAGRTTAEAPNGTLTETPAETPAETPTEAPAEAPAKESVDPIPALVGTLARAGIKLQPAGDGLNVAAPRDALTPELRALIVAHKPALIAWLSAAAPQAGPGPRIVPDEANLYEPFPASDLQQSFIIGSREGFEFHVRPHQYIEMDLEDLDPAAFQDAFNKALQRQRKNIVVVREDLRLQVVRDPEPVEIGVSDFRGLDAEAAEHAIEEIRASMERTEPPHDRWPWVKPHISLYGENRARLHYNNNSLFTDAPSGLGLVVDALHYLEHPDQPLPDVEISYRDCVLGLAELEESPAGQKARDYWVERLAGWPEAPAVPLVAGSRARGRSKLCRRSWVVQEPVWTGLTELAARHGVTTTSALVTVHAEVLSAFSGSRHFLLNNMITHRQFELHPQMSSVLGNFASLYPLEVDLRPDEPFRERVRRLQATLMSDVAHAQWSGVKVLQTLNQVRGTPGRASCPFAIGSALFVGNAGLPHYSLLETPQTLIDTEYWRLAENRMWVVWDVIEDMFPAGLVDAMFAAFRSTLERLAADPEHWDLHAFDLVPSEQLELRRLLNGTPPAADPGTLLHDGLAVQAATAPDRPAVASGTTTLTYGTLYERSQTVAARLRELGAGPGRTVAVLLPKGADQVVAVFGVLESGAAYVPVDPAWPRERRSFLFADADVCAVVTCEALREEAAATGRLPLVCVDSADSDRAHREQREHGEHREQRSAPAARSSDAAAGEPAPTPDDLAYVIYTSGSTGHPKGAMLSHRGPANTVADINERFGVGPDDVLFGASSLCFDLSVYDVFGAAAAGAALALPTSPDPASWVEEVAARGVTVWNSVPALMQLFAEEASRRDVRFPALRTVLLSGDWIPVDLPERIGRIAPNARVVSLGGATEASIWSIHHEIEHVDPDWTSIPYGTPLAGQTWHVLDPAGRDAPTWVEADLYIGGTGVALGYLNDPAKTAAAFLSHPRTGERLYRTGDRGRYLPNGEIEFLGRGDFQVKIQGFRVEPGEVEHALLAEPGVEQAVVLARGAAAGKQLVAYVVGPDPRTPVGEELRAGLAARLPGHLVPGRVVVVDRLPLTANGKLDRAALAAADPDRAAVQERTAPRTGVEAVIAEIWAAILQGGPVSVHDDFFALGGQSFAALRVIGQIAERIGRRVPLGVLLEQRTVARLAAWLADGVDHDWTPLVTLKTGAGRPWFLVHPAGGTVLCYRELAERLDGPVYAFQAPADRPAAQRVEDFAKLYVDALLEVQPDGPYRLAGWSSGAVIAAEMAHRLEQAGRSVERLAVIDAPAPLTARPVQDTQLLLWFLEDLEIGFDAAAVTDAQRAAVAAAPSGLRLAAALALVPEDGARPAPDPADLTGPADVFRTVVAACNGHAAAPIRADVTVVRATRNVVSEFADDPGLAEPDWGWSALSTGQVSATGVEGTHYSLLREPAALARVAEALNGNRPTVQPTAGLDQATPARTR
ncbi:non-ribosomal peptide synthetase [Catenulispora rubra]|uniref:non-ribosomal peptide synthetase n=1 Tax=Catenulispora rubra TaxID=280293 RepID=UPI0018927B4A|nr:non-ribosomal peptide synthetase [Catenulispora rubra]